MSDSSIIWLLLASFGVAVLVLASRPWSGRTAFAIAAVPPALTSVCSIVWLAAGDSLTASVTWVEGLGLEVAFRIDALTALLGLIVAGIGVAVFVYAAGYFSSGAAGLGRFAATLLAFSGSMLGLVWADSVWTLFVFWEMTSVTSFLLVGHKYADPTARIAARRALLITAAGGLVLLAGLLVLTGADGSARLGALQPVGGTTGAVAAVSVVVAAATKSAQVPFHVWLPGAMAAPTPVSAYLHSATMVKAGIILLAVLQPALGDTGPWLPLVVGVGLATMLWGAIGALRQTDAKLILAWGTVSQLGLMVALLGVGEGKATFAAVSILVAHAVFKAALFMVVGEIDVRTGTREIAELGGLWRSMPVAFGVAVLSGLSMAGVPPLLGFAAKEAGIEAALQLGGAERAVLLAGVVGGSVLTVAYTLRFLLGVFAGTAPDGLTVAPGRPAMTVVS
ncbi:MAG: proton-conducting transporter membrane subunit, partial [Ilumatobacter fluminis]